MTYSKKSKKVKFILSLASSLTFYLCTEVLLATIGLNVYIMSYIHENQKWVKTSYCNYIYPVLSSTQSFFILFSGEAEKLFRPQGAMIVGTIIMQISLVGLYYQQNIYLLFPLIILYALGDGISLNIASKNSLFYYPKYVGLISSAELVMSALSEGVFDILGEYIINPEAKLINEKTGFYDLEISRRSKNYFLFAFTVITVGNYLAVFLYQQYIPSEDAEKDDEENENENEKYENENKLTEKLNENDLKINIEENEEGNDENNLLNTSNTSETASLKESFSDIKKIFCTIRVYRNLYLNSGAAFWLYFLTTTFRNYISQVNFDGTIQEYLLAVSDIPQMIAAPLWGILADKCTFRKGITVINICSTVICLFIVFTIQYQYCFAFSVLAMTTLSPAVWVVVPTHLFETYGIKNLLFLEGLITFSEGIFNIGAAILSVILEKIAGSSENLTTVYRITFVVLLIVCLTGFPVSCYEGEEKFDFGDENEIDSKDGKSKNETDKIKKEIKKIEGGLHPESNESDEEENKDEDKNEEKIKEKDKDLEKNKEDKSGKNKGEIRNEENKEVSKDGEKKRGS